MPMKPESLLDTNVVLRHVLNDNPDHSPRATALIAAIQQGERIVRLADTVIFETVYVLEKFYRISRSEIRDGLQPLLDLPGIVLPGKQIYQEVFGLWVREPSLSFADCYHLFFAQHHHLSSIISFDRKLGRKTSIVRVEP